MNINQIVDISWGLCYELSLSDEIWKAFKFKRRPRRGSYFNRLVNKKRRSAEKFLTQELIALNFTIMFSILYSNYHKSRSVLDIHEWKVRGTINEGAIVIGILSRLWQFGSFETLESFLQLIVESIKEYRVENWDENIRYFAGRLSSIETNLSPSTVMVGSAYLFVLSEFARNLKYKVLEYKKLFDNNYPEIEVPFYSPLNEVEGTKIIECALRILEIPD